MTFRLCLLAAVVFCEYTAFGQMPLISAHASNVGHSPLNEANAGVKPAVRVNGAILTEADVVREINTIFPFARQHDGVPKAMEGDIRKGAIEMIVFEELLYQEAKRMKVSIASNRLSRAEAEFRRELGSSAYEQFLRSECQNSNQALREKIRRSLLIEKMLQIEVEQKSVITAVDAKAYYDKNPDNLYYSAPEERSGCGQ